MGGTLKSRMSAEKENIQCEVITIILKHYEDSLSIGQPITKHEAILFPSKKKKNVSVMMHIQPTEDEDSDAIEDRSNICQQPHNHCQLKSEGYVGQKNRKLENTIYFGEFLSDCNI